MRRARSSQFGQSLALFQTLGATWGLLSAWSALARLATDAAQFDVAARLFGVPRCSMKRTVSGSRIIRGRSAQGDPLGHRGAGSGSSARCARTPRFEAALAGGARADGRRCGDGGAAASWPVPPEAVSDPEPRRTPTMIGPLTPRNKKWPSWWHRDSPTARSASAWWSRACCRCPRREHLESARVQLSHADSRVGLGARTPHRTRRRARAELTLADLPVICRKPGVSVPPLT